MFMLSNFYFIAKFFHIFEIFIETGKVPRFANKKKVPT